MIKGQNQEDINKGPKITFKANLILKFIIGIFLSVILYLFALNGRYERLSDALILDKWKKEVVLIGTDELPIKK